MKKLKINKDFFGRTKIVLVTAVLGMTMLTSCRNEDKKSGFEIITTTTITTTTENQTTTTIENQSNTTNSTTGSTITNPTTNPPVEPNIPLQTEIEIKDAVFSKSEVTVYNSDFEISEELEQKINNNIKNFGGDCSFIAINLKDGMSFGYNVDKKYPTASTIKAPFALYCCKQMDAGNGSLKEMKLYEEKFRRGGSGVLKDRKSGVEYSIEDLLYFTINYSDNVAYYMIHDRFYDNSYNEFLKDLGCNNLYLNNGARWGKIDARSMALVWQEIYRYKDESPNGKYLFELLTNAKYNYIKEGMDNYDSAHKSGWTPTETHDSGIVFAEDDYIVVILNNNNGNYAPKSQLIKLSGNIEDVIEEYTLYKKQDKENQKVLTK